MATAPRPRLIVEVPADASPQDPRSLAVVELLGALTYGQLRAFEVTARAVRSAPDARTMDRVATFAVREFRAYTRLRDHLQRRTDLTAAVMDRQKPALDRFFDRAPVDDWHGALTFFAVGLPIASDFVREVAPTLDAADRDVVVAALANRGDAEDYALHEVAALVATDAATRDRLHHLVSDVVGRALTGFQTTATDTDALRILLADDADGADAVVRRVAITVLEGHRRRMVHIGLEDLA